MDVSAEGHVIVGIVVAWVPVIGATRLGPGLVLGWWLAHGGALAGCGSSGNNAPATVSLPAPVVTSNGVATTTVPDREPEPEPLAPLDGESIVELPIDAHEPAVVSVPIGATTPQPIVVATHGAGGRATVHCQLWRYILGARGFVVCPRGRSMYPGIPERRGDAYYYVGHPQLGREMELAVDALRSRFTGHVDAEAPIFAGYSQGASMGALVMPDHPLRFSRAVFVEGGVGKFQEWNVPTAVRFREGGGQRVLMVCGQVECRDRANDSARHFERAGVGVKVIYVAGAGHSYDADMQRQIAESFAWLVEGDDRWAEPLSSSSR